MSQRSQRSRPRVGNRQGSPAIQPRQLEDPAPAARQTRSFDRTGHCHTGTSHRQNSPVCRPTRSQGTRNFARHGRGVPTPPGTKPPGTAAGVNAPGTTTGRNAAQPQVGSNTRHLTTNGGTPGTTSRRRVGTPGTLTTSRNTPAQPRGAGLSRNATARRHPAANPNQTEHQERHHPPKRTCKPAGGAGTPERPPAEPPGLTAAARGGPPQPRRYGAAGSRRPRDAGPAASVIAHATRVAIGAPPHRRRPRTPPRPPRTFSTSTARTSTAAPAPPAPGAPAPAHASAEVPPLTDRRGTCAPPPAGGEQRAASAISAPLTGGIPPLRQTDRAQRRRGQYSTATERRYRAPQPAGDDSATTGNTRTPGSATGASATHHHPEHRNTRHRRLARHHHHRPEHQEPYRRRRLPPPPPEHRNTRHHRRSSATAATEGDAGNQKPAGPVPRPRHRNQRQDRTGNQPQPGCSAGLLANSASGSWTPAGRWQRNRPPATGGVSG